MTGGLGATLAGLFVVLAGCESKTITLGETPPSAFAVDPNAPTSESGGAGPDVICETTSSTTKLLPAYLAFAFDVSGSMGRLDCPFWNHDPWLKWRPVVDATTAFFESAQATGVSASMTLFPARMAACDAASYATPDVKMTALPSTVFRQVLEDYEGEVGLAGYTDPIVEGGGTWRGGTPTHVAMVGTKGVLEAQAKTHPEGRFAMVLVTDGLPQGCVDDSEHLANVVATVSDARLLGIPTYVIGVREPTLPEGASPPWEENGTRVWACKSNAGNWLWEYDAPTVPRPAPDTLGNLHTIAAAGGTERALLIDTGDPDATRAAFQTAVNEIRRTAIPCEFEIPAHPSGGAFEKDKIDIRFDDDGETTTLPYDPSCTPGGGWYYNDEARPSKIMLCPETCTRVSAALTIDFRVDFLCAPREPTAK